MKHKIRTYGGYFEAFMQKLSEKEQEKPVWSPFAEDPRPAKVTQAELA